MQAQIQKKQGIAFFRVLFRVLLVLTSFIGVFVLISIALARAMHQEGLRDRIRSFNKHTLNPATLRIAGNHSRGYSLLEHVGRRSGRTYATPVVASPLGNGFIIPLPYGANTDWCRNVLAAGTCKLRWNGQEYTLEKPEVVSQSAAIHAFPIVQQIIFVAGGIQQYLLLQVAETAPERLSVNVK